MADPRGAAGPDLRTACYATAAGMVLFAIVAALLGDVEWAAGTVAVAAVLGLAGWRSGRTS